MGADPFLRRDLYGLSGNRFVQQSNFRLSDDAYKVHINVELSRRPNLRQIGVVVPPKGPPMRRAKKVRAKLTDDERRNLRVYVFYASEDIRR